MRVKLLTQSALMCAMLIVSTLWLKFTLPGTDVMVTTQVFFVLLSGQLLPPAAGFATVGVYMLMGLAGLPVFSATASPAVLATPSFGYLLGFPFAAMAVALVRQRLGTAAWRPYAASLVGLLAGYAVALPYIAALKALYLNTPLPLAALLGGYLLAFLPLDIAKALLAAALSRRLRKALRIP